MIIIHGTDTKKSYDRLSLLISTYKSNGLTVHHHSPTDLTPTILRQELGNTDLFESRNLLVISGLITAIKSKLKDNLIKYLQNNRDGEVVLYEEKELTPTQLKQFPDAKVEVFNIPSYIFKFLEIIKPHHPEVTLPAYSRLILDTEPEFVFAMLVRQIRLLIQAKDQPSGLKVSPYSKKMLISQAAAFSMDELIACHHRLYKIDKKIKTGSSSIETQDLIYHFLQSI